MRVSTIQWKPGVSWGLKMDCISHLYLLGADVRKTALAFDWWEIEWP